MALRLHAIQRETLLSAEWNFNNGKVGKSIERAGKRNYVNIFFINYPIVVLECLV